MKSNLVKITSAIFFTILSVHVTANTVIKPPAEQIIQEKLNTLNILIEKAEYKKIDISREKMTVSLAQLFIPWIKWDESNIVKNSQYYLDHPVYKKNALTYAKTLPKFQQDSLITVLTHSIEELKLVLSGDISRKPVPNINWETVEIVDNQFVDKGESVFLGSYTWKTDDKLSNQYFGNLNSEYIAPSFIIDNKFNINEKKYRQLKNDTDKRIGQVFVSHKSIPDWAFEQASDLTDGSRLFSTYDIDNPLAKKLFSSLFKNYVPLLKDKRSSDLGYMLFNEPSFFTQADTWNNGEVSAHTKQNFKQWLAEKHKTIGHLNKLWQSDFEKFSSVDIEIPMQSELRGTPIWFDWMRFNQERVTQWFTFLDHELKKHDPTAKTHIKLMPWLWNTDTRDHGLDFESLLEITDIIGFDANSQYSNFRGVQDYEADYSFDWQSAAMSFDFFSSIQPQQLLWDSENHFFNNVKFQERDIDPDYVRAIYWLAATHGLAGSSTWLWGRNPNGSIIQRRSHNSEFITEITHQPIGFHTLTRTLMDINAHGEDIQQLRKITKPIRIFYSETSAINQTDYMKGIRKIYENLYFEGVGLGFITEKIINKSANDWNVIVVHNTPNVTAIELEALKTYANNGGIIIVDNKSLLFNEYNQKHQQGISSLHENESVFVVPNLKSIKTKIKNVLNAEHKSPKIILTEFQNDLHQQHKTLAWRIAEKEPGTFIVSIVNTGHAMKEFSLNHTYNNSNANSDIKITNLLTGITEKTVIKIDKRKTLFLEVTIDK